MRLRSGRSEWRGMTTMPTPSSTTGQIAMSVVAPAVLSERPLVHCAGNLNERGTAKVKNYLNKRTEKVSLLQKAGYVRKTNNRCRTRPTRTKRIVSKRKILGREAEDMDVRYH